ncbi:MAG: DUF5818 domain-containing protein [Candidatus Sulfotelmatobacter sp.]
MKRKVQWVCSVGTFVLLLTVGIALNAQQTSPPATSPDQSATPQSQPNDPTAQQPATTPQGQSSQAPDAGAQAAPNSQAPAPTAASDSQTFTGTIVKSGDRYMLQDTDAGKSYDIDHQDQVKQYEGKKVRVHGTLDSSANMIHLQ